jgi:hypothetical protein
MNRLLATRGAFLKHVIGLAVMLAAAVPAAFGLSSHARQEGTPRPRPSEVRKKRETSPGLEAARIGKFRHKEIQHKLVTTKKGIPRTAEARLPGSRTGKGGSEKSHPIKIKGLRADIVTKGMRVFEIKPDTESGRRERSRRQLTKYENASRRRGAFIFYEPKTGKYRFERTPYFDWKKRQINSGDLSTASRQRERDNQRRADQPRQYDNQRRADQQRQYDNQRRADQQRQYDNQRRADQQRQYDIQRRADQQRQSDNQRRAEQQRQYDNQRRANQQRRMYEQSRRRP